MEEFLQSFVEKQVGVAQEKNKIDPSWYQKFNVKRGLRNTDGTGVLVGLTEIGDVHGYILDENDKVPVQGRLMYRGIDINDLVQGFQDDGRFGFEETVYLLLFGELPNKTALEEFNKILGRCRDLPDHFTEDMILKFPSPDIMNKLARSVLVSYSFDKDPDSLDIANVLRQCIELIARFPTLAAYAYQAKSHYFNDTSLFLHSPQPELSTAENLLYMMRADKQYTDIEAELLDLALVMHAEHGGGNNSAFSVHVVSSSDTDTYSAIAAAIGSLKGPKHGGANIRVRNMIENIKENVSDWTDDEEIANYLRKIIRKEAFDKTGLVYGMGHAVYTLSDPRAKLLKDKAEKLASDKNKEKEFTLYKKIEALTPDLFREEKNSDKVISANVDFYSGFVYSMLNIPPELYTPIFAIARIAGWTAHRIEELISGGRIMRPAYKSVASKRNYTALKDRK